MTAEEAKHLTSMGKQHIRDDIYDNAIKSIENATKRGLFTSYCDIPDDVVISRLKKDGFHLTKLGIHIDEYSINW